MVGDIKSLKEQLEKRIDDSKYTMDGSTFEASSGDISDNTLFNIESLNVSIDGGDKDRHGKIDLKSVQGRAFTISGNCNVEISNIDFTSDHDGSRYDSAYFGKYHGTGILVKSGAVVTIENCKFEKLSVDIDRWHDSENTGFAGIIEVENGGKVIIKNCTIKDSRLLSNGSWGGAVCIQEGGEAEISDTTIEGIRGGHCGGALMVLGECTMKNCTISSNTAGDGAGISLYNGDKSASEAHLLAENCTIQSNDARESCDTRKNQGGAGYIECNGTAEFIDCEIKDNSSIAAEGKAFYVLRGTLILDEESRKNISSSHNIFVKSSATYNGTTYDKDTTISSP
nr:right-handed parallel beta-helix repeat-containing protein [uncultured Treponema sp.]